MVTVMVTIVIEKKKILVGKKKKGVKWVRGTDMARYVTSNTVKKEKEKRTLSK